MSDQKFVEGFRFFPRKENQPDFVLGSIVLTPELLIKWLDENPDKVTQYNGKEQIKFQVKKSKKGEIYCQLDTYGTGSSNESSFTKDSESLPF